MELLAIIGVVIYFWYLGQKEAPNESASRSDLRTGQANSVGQSPQDRLANDLQSIVKRCLNPSCKAQLRLPTGRRGYVRCPKCGQRALFDTTSGPVTSPPRCGPTAERHSRPTNAQEVGRDCPRCNNGRLVHRNGKFGPFIGCSAFPTCRYSEGGYKNSSLSQLFSNPASDSVDNHEHKDLEDYLGDDDDYDPEYEDLDDSYDSLEDIYGDDEDGALGEARRHYEDHENY